MIPIRCTKKTSKSTYSIRFFCRYLAWALIFEMFDIKQDGTISKQELLQVLEEKNVQIKEEEMAPFFSHIDEDDDGRISYREFLKFKLG